MAKTNYPYDTHSMNDSSEPQDHSTTQLLSSTVYAWVVTECPLLGLQ